MQMGVKAGDKVLIPQVSYIKGGFFWFWVCGRVVGEEGYGEEVGEMGEWFRRGDMDAVHFSGGGEG